MFASPLIPGQLYRVNCQGATLEVIAANGCDAICIAIDILEGSAC